MNILELFRQTYYSSKRKKERIIYLDSVLDLIREECFYHNKNISVNCTVIDIKGDSYYICPDNMSLNIFKKLKVVIKCNYQQCNFVLYDRLTILISDFELIKSDGGQYVYKLILNVEEIKLYEDSYIVNY